MASEKIPEEKMASGEMEKKAESDKKEQNAGQAKKKRQPAESIYTAKELADSAKNTFGTRKECVLAALEAAGKQKCTVSEAKKIVERFLRKEVE